MTGKGPGSIEGFIIAEASSQGAAMAGIADAGALRHSPSHRASADDVWAEGARSVLVLALAHDPAEPELDWWGGPLGTPGNRRLHVISGILKRRLREAFGIAARVLPYQPEKGGIFLKDAAVLAGLGTIGANNLLITPKYGPRVRLRALFLDADLRPAGPIDFSPCAGCAHGCWKACPRDAFRSGKYDAARCRERMREDESRRCAAADPGDPSAALVKYCRACELSCGTGG